MSPEATRCASFCTSAKTSLACVPFATDNCILVADPTSDVSVAGTPFLRDVAYARMTTLQNSNPMILPTLLTALFELLTSGVLIAELPRWPLVHTIPAAEAHQAAAATQEHFYAISSTDVARYDRKSGTWQAISSGDAKHLNSGFLWNDRLLLAHSNYPALPEQSQVMQLNLQTMQLAVFHDFRDYGGT